MKKKMRFKTHPVAKATPLLLEGICMEIKKGK